ncbi:MAG: aminotransferase class V-fold PLP-dependent enzyme [Gemmatimonadales bacterium]
MTMDKDLRDLRRVEFPWANETVYLNHASTGPLPERTRLVLESWNRRRTMPFTLPDPELFAVFTTARALAARLVNAHPDEIALATNTSWGLALAAAALPLKAGDVVVVSDKEFPANVYPWLLLKERGVQLDLVPTTPEGWPDEAAMLGRLERQEVKAVAVSLVQFSNGYQADLAAFSAATRRLSKFLVVDGIQGVGQVPVDLAATPVDILSCGGQKWLLSGWGSGFTYVRRELIARLRPAMTGWMAFEGTDDFSRLTAYDPTLRRDARRFEMITLPFHDLAGFNSSVEMLLSVGIDRIAAHLVALHAPVIAAAERSGARITSPGGARGSGILCVAPRDLAGSFARLKAAGVHASLREGAIRLSPHFYTTPEEMERVAEVLERKQ